MPKITFSPSDITLDVEQPMTIYDAARQAGLPVASSCDGDGVCGKCNVQVLVGEENLEMPSDLERRLLEKEKKPSTDRISCLTKIINDCVVTTRYW